MRRALPAAYQDVLDFAYYSGWRKREILDLRWTEVDEAGGVVRLSPARSKTRVGRVLPITAPIAAVLSRRRVRRRPGDATVFTRDATTVRSWRRAWPLACRQAGVPGRLLHDCRRTAARNLVRAGVSEGIAMVLTGHTTRAVFDRYCIVNEADLHQAGAQLVAYLEGGAKAGDEVRRRVQQLARPHLMEHAAERGDPRVPLRGHPPDGTARAHRAASSPRPAGRTGTDQPPGQPGGHKTRSSAF